EPLRNVIKCLRFLAQCREVIGLFFSFLESFSHSQNSIGLKKSHVGER
ncbi:unnamed protein product, partial [Brassica rapa subsp. narinosa]